MAPRNIAAYTANKNPYPEYISVNDHHGGVSIMVRGPVRIHGNQPAEGEVIEIIMTDADFAKFLTDAVTRFPGRFDDPNQSKLDV